MKPSERIREMALADAESTQKGRDRLLSTWGHPDITLVHIERHLDEEHERRQKWEASVGEFLEGLGFGLEPPSTRYGRCDRCGAPLEKVIRAAGEQRWCGRGCVAPKDPT